MTRAELVGEIRRILNGFVKQPTREVLINELAELYPAEPEIGKVISYDPKCYGCKDLLKALQDAWASGRTREKWCCHCQWIDGALRGWHYTRTGDCMGSLERIDKEWTRCPICGAPRPSEKEAR